MDRWIKIEDRSNLPATHRDVPVIANKWLKLAHIDEDGAWVDADEFTPLDVEMWYDLPMPGGTA